MIYRVVHVNYFRHPVLSSCICKRVYIIFKTYNEVPIFFCYFSSLKGCNCFLQFFTFFCHTSPLYSFLYYTLKNTWFKFSCVYPCYRIFLLLTFKKFIAISNCFSPCKLLNLFSKRLLNLYSVLLNLLPYFQKLLIEFFTLFFLHFFYIFQWIF